MRTYEQVNKELAAKSKTLHEVFEEAGPEMDFDKVRSLEGDTGAKVEKVRELNKELEALGIERDRLAEMGDASRKAAEWDSTLNHPQTEKLSAGPEKKEEKRTLGQLFIESKAAETKHTVRKLDIDVKTLFETAAGWDPEATRIPRVELYPLAPIAVVDVIPMGNTGMDTIKYMKESTFTNLAAEAAAGTTYGEAALVYTETSDEVEKIGVWLPVTDEQLEDVAGLESLLNQRLTYMLRARLCSQILVGTGRSGGTPDLVGTLDLAAIQTQDKGSDATPDAFYKAMTLVRATGFAEPSICIVHPNDWQDIRLLTTADGIYIFGSPSDAGPERLWGVPVLQTTAVTENTGIVGDYRGYSMLFMRRGIEFQVTNAHSDFFIKGKQAIRCDMRCSMVHFRDTAFCSVTSI